MGYAEPLPLDPRDTVLVLVDVQEHITPRALRASLTAAGLYNEDVEPVIELWAPQRFLSRLSVVRRS